jgi:hypothetical protein
MSLSPFDPFQSRFVTYLLNCPRISTSWSLQEKVELYPLLYATEPQTVSQNQQQKSNTDVRKEISFTRKIPEPFTQLCLAETSFAGTQRLHQLVNITNVFGSVEARSAGEKQAYGWMEPTQLCPIQLVIRVSSHQSNSIDSFRM